MCSVQSYKLLTCKLNVYINVKSRVKVLCIFYCLTFSVIWMEKIYTIICIRGNYLPRGGVFELPVCQIPTLPPTNPVLGITLIGA